MITIKLQYQTQFGQAIYVSGESKLLGQWNPIKAIRMQWHENNIWTAQIASHTMKYKFFISDFENIGKIEWENGPNRLTNSDSFDIWGKRLVCFRSPNPKGFNLYISWSDKRKGTMKSRLLMKNKNGYSQLKALVDVQDGILYYQYHFNQKMDFTTSIFTQPFSTDLSYYKNYILVQCQQFSKLQQVIFSFSEQIFYGLVPNQQSDYHNLQKEKLTTIIEMCKNPEGNIFDQLIKEGCLHYIINVYYFTSEKQSKTIINMVKLLIKKYKKVYICNNSLLHLRKYLHYYQKLGDNFSFF